MYTNNYALMLGFGNSQIANTRSIKETINEFAYYRSEQRGFEPGHEMDDWLAAEKEILEGFKH